MISLIKAYHTDKVVTGQHSFSGWICCDAAWLHLEKNYLKVHEQQEDLYSSNKHIYHFQHNDGIYHVGCEPGFKTTTEAGCKKSSA